MTRRPEPLTDHAVERFETELIQALRRAARTRDLRPVVQLADFLIASGITTRTRGNLLGFFWFQTEMLYGFRGNQNFTSPHALLGLQLVHDALCTDLDMENGISEYLFMLGAQKGSLPDTLYDLMMDTGKHRKSFTQAVRAAKITILSP